MDPMRMGMAGRIHGTLHAEVALSSCAGEAQAEAGNAPGHHRFALDDRRREVGDGFEARAELCRPSRLAASGWNWGPIALRCACLPEKMDRAALGALTSNYPPPVPGGMQTLERRGIEAHETGRARPIRDCGTRSAALLTEPAAAPSNANGMVMDPARDDGDRILMDGKWSASCAGDPPCAPQVATPPADSRMRNSRASRIPSSTSSAWPPFPWDVARRALDGSASKPERALLARAPVPASEKEVLESARHG